MRYKNSDDNRYRVQFMRSTEELMDQLLQLKSLSLIWKKTQSLKITQ